MLAHVCFKPQLRTTDQLGKWRCCSAARRCRCPLSGTWRILLRNCRNKTLFISKTTHWYTVPAACCLSHGKRTRKTQFLMFDSTVLFLHLFISGYTQPPRALDCLPCLRQSSIPPLRSSHNRGTLTKAALMPPSGRVYILPSCRARLWG